MSVTKAEADLVLTRIQALVKKRGGTSARLERLRSAYALWYPTPGDPGSFALLVEEVERQEQMP